MSKRILYLIRHGEYAVETPNTESPDGPLTPKGIIQAQLTAQRLKDLPIQSLYSSDSQRAMETGNYIALLFPQLTPCANPILRECTPYSPDQMETPAGVQKISVTNGIEKAQEAFGTFFKIPEENGVRHEVIISHCNLIRYFLTQIIQAPADSWVHFKIHPASITEVHIHPSGFHTMVRVNDTAHFPEELLSDE